MLSEFKKFAMRGNVLDMAVGIIIGAAFGGVIKSMVADVMMPPLGMLMGKADFSEKFINLSDSNHLTIEAAKKAGDPTLRWGLFVNQVINFVIVAFAVFLLIKAVNKLTAKEEEEKPPPAPSKEEVLLTEIRDAIQAK